MSRLTKEALDVQVQMVHKSETIRKFVSTGPQLPVAMYVRYYHPHVRMLTPEERPVLTDGFSWMVAGEA